MFFLFKSDDFTYPQSGIFMFLYIQYETLLNVVSSMLWIGFSSLRYGFQMTEPVTKNYVLESFLFFYP